MLRNQLLPRDVMLARYMLGYMIRCLCLPRPSVTRRYCIETIDPCIITL